MASALTAFLASSGLSALLVLAAPGAAADPLPAPLPDVGAPGPEDGPDAILAWLVDAVADQLDRVKVRSPVEAEFEAGIECRPSRTPEAQECHGYVCMRSGGEGDDPIHFAPDADGYGVGVDLDGLGSGGPYGPYTGIYVTLSGNCGCTGWFLLKGIA